MWGGRLRGRGKDLKQRTISKREKKWEDDMRAGYHLLSANKEKNGERMGEKQQISIFTRNREVIKPLQTPSRT
jgi:hypothetical protein